MRVCVGCGLRVFGGLPHCMAQASEGLEAATAAQDNSISLAKEIEELRRALKQVRPP